MGKGGRLTWQSYLDVTIVAPYPSRSGHCWGAGEPVSHSFPNPTRGTSDPRLLRKATSRKSIYIRTWTWDLTLGTALCASPNTTRLQHLGGPNFEFSLVGKPLWNHFLIFGSIIRWWIICLFFFFFFLRPLHTVGLALVLSPNYY